MRFQVITAAYDCPQYIEACLRSIATQQLNGFGLDVCVVSDAPPQPQGEWQNKYIQEFCAEHGWAQCIINGRRMGALYNQVAAIKLLGGSPDDVLVFVDGDDRLIDGLVLDTLADVYANPNIWLTYGSYTPEPSSETCTGPHPIPREAWYWPGGFRTWAADHNNMCFNHLRTFRRKLLSGMLLQDWTWPHGEWFMCAGDSAMMVPAIELAGEDRIRMISEPLLVYTSNHPLADWRLRPGEIERVHQYILRGLPAKVKMP